MVRVMVPAVQLLVWVLQNKGTGGLRNGKTIDQTNAECTLSAKNKCSENNLFIGEQPNSLSFSSACCMYFRRPPAHGGQPSEH